MKKLDEVVKVRNPDRVFKIDDFCEKTIQLMASYFCRTCATVMDRNKGILLCGPVGAGKSTIFTAFEDNSFSSFRTIKAQAIVDMYKENPKKAMELVTTPKAIKAEYGNKFGHSRFDILIEEVGREQLSINVNDESFKNEAINVFERIFFELYEHPKLRVHIATNANTEEKRIKLYGVAVASRMHDMFNIITMNEKSPDRRINYD
jgi:predicted Ser/Thr protein kinase